MTQSNIVKIFTGKHVDLSKVVSISDAEFIDRMGVGGWLVGFEMVFQLMDKPTLYEREVNWSESKFSMEDGHEIVYGKDGITPLAVENLQNQIDDLVKQWKEVAARQ